MTCMNREIRIQLSQKITQWNNNISEDTNYTQLDDETLGV